MTYTAPLTMVVAVFGGSAQVEEPSAGLGTNIGKPTDRCQELVAFVHQPDAAKKADQPPPQLAAVVPANKYGLM